MRSFASLLTVGIFAAQAIALPDPSKSTLNKRSTDSWIATESPIAFAKLLCNIGSDGCASSGVASGLVIASPSKSDPDYFFHWTRDSALVFKYVVDNFVASTYSPSVQAKIQNYIIGQAKLQGVSNPSGSLSDGKGLGEAKYKVDGSAYTGGWGRPQRDGPALRATAMVTYANWLVDNGYSATASSVVWPIIQNDLAYVIQYWNQTGFDLWEEVQGSSFFTTAVQHRALVESAALATKLGETCSNCLVVAPQIRCFLKTFWNPTSNYVVSNINVNNGRTGKDANSILASIHTFDPLSGCDDSTFQPCSARALANHKSVTDSFRSIYTLNSGIAQGVAVAVGRYAEDTYYGGNPWYLNTLAAAEQLYDALYQWKSIGSISITSVSLGFWKDIYPSAAVGTYASTTTTYIALTGAVKSYADGYMDNAAKYTPSNGALAEQYSRSTGAPLSAVDLTWSYASFLTCANRRAGIVPPSWGASGANTLPATCDRSGYSGSYTSATSTAFPTSQTPKGSGTTPTTVATSAAATTTACKIASTVAVTFNEIKTTTYGQTVKLAGSIAPLGSWAPASALALSASLYTTSKNLWYITVNLPAGTTFEYKFMNIAASGAVTWESSPNRQYTVPNSCATAVTVDTTWR